jgi:hypothetical protein
MNAPDLSAVRICWGTPIVEVENPDHLSIKRGLEQHCYERYARDQGAISSGVAPVAKTGLYESAFDLFEAQARAIQSLKTFCADSLLATLIQLEQQLANDTGCSRNATIDLHESWCLTNSCRSPKRRRKEVPYQA